MPKKRVLIISDLHAGAKLGITPPEWQGYPDAFQKSRKHFWSEFKRILRKAGVPDLLIVNGDCIDGDAKRTNGIGLITSDRLIQCEMAIRTIEEVKAKSIVIVKGTDYHTGQSEDFEEIIADRVGAIECSDHAFIKINNCIIDAKHKIGGSSIPHGIFTAPARDRLSNLLWAELGQQPKANIVIRSHLHSFALCSEGQYLAIVTPGLQWSTRYGSRQCSRPIHWGMVWIDIESNGSYRTDWEIINIKEQKVKITVI